MGPSHRSHSYRDAVKSVLVCISFMSVLTLDS